MEGGWEPGDMYASIWQPHALGQHRRMREGRLTWAYVSIEQSTAKASHERCECQKQASRSQGSFAWCTWWMASLNPIFSKLA
eukprot:3941201-Rhodomonas_salina.14